MKYLVAGELSQELAHALVAAGRFMSAPPPAKSLKKLPGFAGNTNVMMVTEKGGPGAAYWAPEGYGGMQKSAKTAWRIN